MLRKKNYPYDGAAKVLVFCIAIVLLIPAIGLFFTDDIERSKWEKRPLAGVPVVGKDNAKPFLVQLDDYLNDHFGYAVHLNQYYRKAIFYIFNDSPSASITLGNDAYVFLNKHGAKAKKYSAFESLCIRSTQKNWIRDINASWEKIILYLEGQQHKVYFSIAPSKPILYPEKFPREVPRRLREACGEYLHIESVASTLKKNLNIGRVVIYPIDEFVKARYNGNFYPKENFHFNSDSSHLFSKIILKKIGISFPSSYDDFFESNNVKFDLHTLFGFHVRLTANIYPYKEFNSKILLKKPETVKKYYARVNDYGSWETEAPLSDRKLLILSNSFGYFLANHLAPGFTETTWININHLQKDEVELFFSELVPSINADDILILFHDGGLQRGLSLTNAYDFK